MCYFNSEFIHSVSDNFLKPEVLKTLSLPYNTYGTMKSDFCFCDNRH